MKYGSGLVKKVLQHHGTVVGFFFALSAAGDLIGQHLLSLQNLKSSEENNAQKGSSDHKFEQAKTPHGLLRSIENTFHDGHGSWFINHSALKLFCAQVRSVIIDGPDDLVHACFFF